ncbi:MAG TPA: TolC family protein [Gemmatimonadales bacterium]|nr:TolC family protein [Gemmatimonadales bacterium]
MVGLVTEATGARQLAVVAAGRVFLSLFFVLLGPRAVAAQAAGDTLRLADAVAAARAVNPMLQAVRLSADAAAERVPQAGALPDPQLEFGLVNRMLPSFSAEEPMTMNEVRLRQMFPWPGKLGFGKQRARHLARAGGFEALDAEVMLVSRVKAVYAELAYMDRALAIMDRTRGLLRDFFQVSQAMYSVGEGLQQDVLQAQVAVARMTEDIVVMQQERLAMAARLNALMGRGASEPIGPLELADPAAALPALPGVDSLMARAAAGRPALQAAYERVRAADAGYRAARRELYPDFMVQLAYGQRPQFDDMATVMLGFSIPLWAGARQLPMRREMAAMRAGEDAMARELYNETFAELTERRAQAERARSLAELYDSSILPQARAAVEAALSAYRVGRVNYMTLVESEMTVNRYEIELVRLAAAYQQAVAEIEALVGGEGGAR